MRVNLGVNNDIGATACDVVTRNLNDLLTLEKYTPDTTYNPNDPRARAGTFTILPTFINATAEGRPTGIVAIYFKVAELTGFNKVLNVDEGLGQEGSTIVVQPDVLGTDGVLQPGEAFRFSFDIGIDKSGSFSFFVDTFGIAVGPFAESE